MDNKPNVIGSVFVSGNVKMGGNVSLFHGASIRGDLGEIEIGDYSNVQDNATVHCSPNMKTTIGKYVSVGHNAVVHSATVGDGTVVGMGAILLNGCVIGSGCIIGAGSVIGQNKVIPDNSIVIGNPFRILRESTENDRAKNIANAERYAELGKSYLNGEFKII